PLRGAVIGGGLLGLEAAGALQELDVACTVLQATDRLMSAQLDRPAGDALRRIVEKRGLRVGTEAVTTRIDADPSGHVAGLTFDDGSSQEADVVVFAVGVRPRDKLAREAGLEMAERGGVVIDPGCGTSDP